MFPFPRFTILPSLSLSPDSLWFAVDAQSSPVLHSFLEQPESRGPPQPRQTTGTQLTLSGTHVQPGTQGSVNVTERWALFILVESDLLVCFVSVCVCVWCRVSVLM